MILLYTKKIIKKINNKEMSATKKILENFLSNTIDWSFRCKEFILPFTLFNFQWGITK